jgi:hypothetical protein
MLISSLPLAPSKERAQECAHEGEGECDDVVSTAPTDSGQVESECKVATMSPGALQVAPLPLFPTAAEENCSHHIRHLLSLIQSRPLDEETCAQVFQTLVDLTFFRKKRQTIVQQGGVQAALEGLVNHKSSSLLSLVMEALWNFTFDESAVELVVGFDGVQHIVGVMRQHASVAELQRVSCATLLNIATRADGRAQLVKTTAVDLIADAMRQHAGNEDVLQLCCQSLCLLTHHRDSRSSELPAKLLDAALLAASHEGADGRTRKWGQCLLARLVALDKSI